MQSVLIRNNTLGVRSIGEVKLIPGETKRLTEDQLAPFMGNKAFQGAFIPSRDFPFGMLQEIPENSPPPPDALGFRENAPQPAKPAPKAGETTPIRVDTAEGKAALDKFLQEGTIPPAREIQQITQADVGDLSNVLNPPPAQ